MFLRKKKKFGLGSPSSKVDYFGRTQSNSLGKNEESRRMNDCLFLPFFEVQSPSTTNPRVRINQCSKSVTNRITEKTVPVFVLSGYSKLGENFIITHGEEGVENGFKSSTIPHLPSGMSGCGRSACRQNHSTRRLPYKKLNVCVYKYMCPATRAEEEGTQSGVVHAGIF